MFPYTASASGSLKKQNRPATPKEKISASRRVFTAMYRICLWLPRVWLRAISGMSRVDSDVRMQEGYSSRGNAIWETSP